jgi:hypothetical protein
VEIDRSSLISIVYPNDWYTLDEHAEWFARFHMAIKKTCGPDWMLSVGVDPDPPQFRMNGFTRSRIRKALDDAVLFHRPSGHRICLLHLTYWNAEHVFAVDVHLGLGSSGQAVSYASVSLSFSSTSRLDAATRLSWFRALVEIYPVRSGHFTSPALWDRVKEKLGPPGEGLEWDLFVLGWAMYWSEPMKVEAVPEGWTARIDQRGGTMLEMERGLVGSLDPRAVDLGCGFLRASLGWPTRFQSEVRSL